MTEGMVALRRDLAERSKLEVLSKDINGVVVTVTDGPIELWGAQGEDARMSAEFVGKYTVILSRLQSRGVITAGYVDKPSAITVQTPIPFVRQENNPHNARSGDDGAIHNHPNGSE